MASELKEARRAVARGANDEALVHLWNAVEPARLRGDRRALAAIGGLAQAVQHGGDEGQRREAERLLELLREQASEGHVPATAALDAQVTGAGGFDPGETAVGTGPEPVETYQADEETTGRAVRIGNVLWLAFVALIVLVNVLGRLGD